MLELEYRTKGNAIPKGKPRVFFTCHPGDVERSLDRLCSDLFSAQDCAVYFTADMSEMISDEDRYVHLEQMNLFVIPVSLKLLSVPNRAMDFDVPFALEKQIPILPVMLDPGLEAVYSRPDKFGSLQYLDPDLRDGTAISYDEKMKNFLASVFIDDKTQKRIRETFDGYVFLSYRKKDRKHANELIRFIHANPKFRDLAIWYDEYLVPGENFGDSIIAALEKSDLFALLVTPNLINETNYIQVTEYPAAKACGKTIFPVEMEKTDREELEKAFIGIPDCVAPDSEEFGPRLHNSLQIDLQKKLGDPEHEYLIGLAYLDGIDMEVDKVRGTALIAGAAEAGLPEAMKKLRDMYYQGVSVSTDYYEALRWGLSLVARCTELFGEGNPETLEAMNCLSILYMDTGNYRKALESAEKVYDLTCRISGENHPDTLAVLSNLSYAYSRCGEYRKALELAEKTYDLSIAVLGETHPGTLIALDHMSELYSKNGNDRKALSYAEQSYSLHRRILGEENTSTLTALDNLSSLYLKVHEFHKALELAEEAYALHCREQGEYHLHTLHSLQNLAQIYETMGELDKAKEMLEKVSSAICKDFGNEHPSSLSILNELAVIYGKQGNYEKNMELQKKVYDLSCRTLGNEHPDTIAALNNIAASYASQKNYNKAREYYENVSALCSRVLGEEHPNTLRSLYQLAFIYDKLHMTRRAQKLMSKVMRLNKKTKAL